MPPANGRGRLDPSRTRALTQPMVGTAELRWYAPAMNEEQLAHWNGFASQRWTERQSALDRALHAFGQAALERADPHPAERVLDVGCGCGDSTLALAERVGQSGSVLGV